MNPCCQNCLYVKFLKQVERYVCRRFPPSHAVEDVSRLTFHFPTVNQEDWCGEYRPKARPGPAGETTARNVHPDKVPAGKG